MSILVFFGIIKMLYWNLRGVLLGHSAHVECGYTENADFCRLQNCTIVIVMVWKEQDLYAQIETRSWVYYRVLVYYCVLVSIHWGSINAVILGVRRVILGVRRGTRGGTARRSYKHPLKRTLPSSKARCNIAATYTSRDTNPCPPRSH